MCQQMEQLKNNGLKYFYTPSDKKWSVYASS